MLRRLDRYVVAEILGPLTLGFLVYTFILLMRFLFASAEMIIRRGVPAGDVGHLLMLTLPNIVVLTIPMALLFAILVASGRLATDSELVALRACGVSLYSLYRPVLALSALLTLLNGFLMVQVLPRGNHSLQQLTVDILGRSIPRQVEPRVFYEGWENLVVYVFGQQPGEDTWQGVFVADSLPSSENEITVASRGDVRIDESGERLLLHLEDAVTHSADFGNPAKYDISRYRTVDDLLEDRFLSRQQAVVATSKGPRQMLIPELRRGVGDAEVPVELRNRYRAEIHKRFSIPAACFVFGLLALPLGLSNRRGGRSSGFALSIGVILVYYVLLDNGEEAATVGKVSPWLAMWLPNLVLGSAGLLLAMRRNRERGLRAMLDQIRGLAVYLWRRAAALARRLARLRADRASQRSAAAAAPEVVVRLPRMRPRFPNRLDRYIMSTVLLVLLMVTLSGVTVYVIADFTDRSDEIFENQIPTEVVLRYYKYRTFQMAHEIAPVAVLVTTLIAFGIHSQRNEVTAAKASGISLYRLALPALTVALGVVAFGFAMQMRVLPASNRVVSQLEDRIMGREGARSYRRADRQWLFGQGRYIYNYLHYDEQRQVLHRLQVFEFDHEQRLKRRLFAQRATYKGDSWLFEGAWSRSFDGLETVSFEVFDRPVLGRFPEKPGFFESDVELPDAMSLGELRQYLKELEASGQSAPELRVKLHEKWAMPVFPLVLGLVALPFSFRLGRRGALYGVGIGIVLGIVFFGLFALFSTLGQTGLLAPVVAVWSPGVMFAVLSLYLFLGVRS